MILPQEPDLVIERNSRGIIRELRHLQKPAQAALGQSAKQAALAYLKIAALERKLLPLDQRDWDNLSATIEAQGSGRSGHARYRWAETRELKRRSQVETTIVWCQQTATDEKNPKLVPDVMGCSIRLVVHHRSEIPQITSLWSTAIENPLLSLAPDRLERAFGEIDPTWFDILPAELARTFLAPILGLPDPALGIHDARLVAYRRTRDAGHHEGRLGFAIGATVFMPAPSGDSIAHRVLFDITENEIVHKAPIASACAGYAFLNDPDSKEGGFAIRPDSGAALLDPDRDPVGLLDLHHASSGRRELAGPRIRVRAPAALGKEYDPPRQRPPFAFTARSNGFAAVSAYCHCDSMMRQIEEFGYDLSDYFGQVTLPLTVEHRARMLSGSGARDGRGINAYVTPFRPDKATSQWDVRMLFGLADAVDTWKYPLGLAADVRFVWHEFCHVLILAATGSTEFDFAHSAGDALAAIMCDPTSKLSAASRGITFPFVRLPLRRHDRDVAKGWGWNGTHYERPTPTYGLRDPAGYNAEQILSSTLFRLYRAVGGDAVCANAAGQFEADIESRKAAAFLCAHLIVRAIRSLAKVATQATQDALLFATALMDADIGTPLLDYDGSEQPGGMTHKVIRWAFEQQGLYQNMPGRTQNEPGQPPKIDIYVDDRRRGTYEYSPDWHAPASVLWVRRTADGDTTDQPPKPGETNYVYVVVSNRGDQPAVATTMDVFAATGDAVQTWDIKPGKWLRLQGSNTNNDIGAGGSAVFGPFAWTPQAASTNALLVRTSVVGDQSNIDDDCKLPCAAGPAPLPDLVRRDNNLACREWVLP